MCLAQGPQRSDTGEAPTCGPCIIAYISRETRGLNFDLKLHLHPYFVYVSSKGYGQNEHLKYLNVMNSVILSFHRVRMPITKFQLNPTYVLGDICLFV